MANLRTIIEHDPFLSPNWRAERVADLLRFTPPRRTDRFDDKYIQEFRKFRIAARNTDAEARRNLMLKQPGLFYANKIYERKAVEPNVANILEARLLSGMSYEEIAQKLKLLPDTVIWYECLFFNVGNRLEFDDWILHSVLIPAFDRHVDADASSDSAAQALARARSSTVALPQLDMSLKFFAYFGGPLVCDIMISGFQRNHVKKLDELATYLDEQFATQIKRRSLQAAMQFEINKFNVMELFAVHTRLMEIQRSAANTEDRHNELEKTINQLMQEFPWSVGRSGAQLYDNKLIGEYDQTAVEPDATELLNAGANIRILDLEQAAVQNVFIQRS